MNIPCAIVPLPEPTISRLISTCLSLGIGYLSVVKPRGKQPTTILVFLLGPGHVSHFGTLLNTFIKTLKDMPPDARKLLIKADDNVKFITDFMMEEKLDWAYCKMEVFGQHSLIIASHGDTICDNAEGVLNSIGIATDIQTTQQHFDKNAKLS